MRGMENHRFTVSGGRAALAALLLFAGGRTAGGGEVAYAGAERVHVEFRAVDESADLGTIFGAGRPLPEGYEAVAGGEGAAPLWRRIGEAPSEEELARLRTFGDRPRCDLLLERRMVGDDEVFSPLYVFRKAGFDDGDVLDVRLEKPWFGDRPRLSFSLGSDGVRRAAKWFRQFAPGKPLAARGGKSWGRLAAVADGRLLGVATLGRTSLLFPPGTLRIPCSADEEQAKAVAEALHPTAPTHLYTVKPLPASDLTAGEARERAMADMERRYRHVIGPKALPIEIRPEGEDAIAVTLCPMRPIGQQYLLVRLQVPQELTFRAVAVDSAQRVADWLDGPAPDEGYQTVDTPSGRAWAAIPGGPADTGDDIPSLDGLAVPDGCAAALEPVEDGEGRRAWRPWCLVRGGGVRFDRVASVRTERDGDGRPVLCVEPEPADREALAALSASVGPDGRLAVLFNGRVERVEGGGNALAAGPIRVGRVLSTYFPGGDPETLAEIFDFLAGLMQAGMLPANLSWTGTR
jgi:hypothetical protein